MKQSINPGVVVAAIVVVVAIAGFLVYKGTSKGSGSGANPYSAAADKRVQGMPGSVGGGGASSQHGGPGSGGPGMGGPGSGGPGSGGPGSGGPH